MTPRGQRDPNGACLLSKKHAPVDHCRALNCSFIRLFVRMMMRRALSWAQSTQSKRVGGGVRDEYSWSGGSKRDNCAE